MIRALATSRKNRRKNNAFFVEGVHAITAAYRNQWDVQTLLYCPDTIHTEWAKNIIARTPLDTRLEVSAYIHTQLSDRETPSELMAVIAQRADDLERIPITPDLLTLLLDRPRSPGNLGSTIRSADALGARAVIITGHAADVYDPKTVRASMGSLFEIPVVRVQAHHTLEAWLEQARATLGHVRVVATSAHAPQYLYDYDLTGPTVVIIGNEQLGISEYYHDLCDAFVSIPISGSATSLNASVAASIFLYEISRQRKGKA